MPVPSTTVTVAGREVRVSNPDKIYFEALGRSKLDLVRYYSAVEEPLLRALGGRPVMLERYPEGAGGPSFFQKRVPKGAPEWLVTTTVSTVNGTESQALVLADLAHVVWAVNLGCLGFHVWPYRHDDPGVVDELRIDLDPMPGVHYSEVLEAAVVLYRLCGDMGLELMPKTSGSRGVHLYARLVPEWDAYAVRTAAVALAREAERRRPDLVTAAWWKEQRGRRVFVDYNQNAPHKTVFGAWCARPRPTGQVSTPLSWDDLLAVDPESLTIDVVPGRVRDTGDPWAAMTPQDITPLLEMAAADSAAGLPDAPWPPQYPKMPDEPPRVQPSRARRGGDGPR